jgi:hypothetical protein
MNLLFVGERRSPLAIKRGVRWENEALAAVPLFEALRAAGIDPATCQFVNWFEGGKTRTRKHRRKGRIVGLGKRVQRALAAEDIPHIPLIHPAARGLIRRRANYIAHVVDALRELHPRDTP